MLDEIGSHLLRLKGKHKFHSNLSISWVLFNSGWYIVLDIPSPKNLFTVPRLKLDCSKSKCSINHQKKQSTFKYPYNL